MDIEKKLSLEMVLTDEQAEGLDYLMKKWSRSITLDEAIRIAIMVAADKFRTDDRNRAELLDAAEKREKEEDSGSYEVDGRDF